MNKNGTHTGLTSPIAHVEVHNDGTYTQYTNMLYNQTKMDSLAMDIENGKSVYI